MTTTEPPLSQAPIKVSPQAQGPGLEENRHEISLRVP